MSPDERALLDLIGERIEQGRATYGPLYLDSDDRDFETEALEEILDAVVYLAAAILKLRRV